MLERRQRRPYWRNTRLQMLLCLIVPCVLLPLLPLAITRLNPYVFLGFPVGYLVAAHGFIIAGFLTVVWYVRRQDAIDQWHGAHEDL